uniref:EF-hand domain-containing protein n=1 Tax=Neogobius melanostomus TaxID=47308 RepID=A0A8C6WZ58_9GOBI
MAPYLSRSVLSVLLIHLCLAAPGQPNTNREEDSIAAVAYPFESKEESHRLLRSYIDFILNKEVQERPEINSWEQEVFFVFRLHDYDRSGLLDGLEMIKLLYDFNSFHTPGVVHSHNAVVTVVDYLLQTQDLNHDGLFSPSELLSPLPTQHEETVKNVIEVEVQRETQPQQKERTEEDSPVASVNELHTPQEAQNNPIAGQAENIAPVHQGQPEM